MTGNQPNPNCQITLKPVLAVAVRLTADVRPAAPPFGISGDQDPMHATIGLRIRADPGKVGFEIFKSSEKLSFCGCHFAEH